MRSPSPSCSSHSYRNCRSFPFLKDTLLLLSTTTFVNPWSLIYIMLTSVAYLSKKYLILHKVSSYIQEKFLIFLSFVSPGQDRLYSSFLIDYQNGSSSMALISFIIGLHIYCLKYVWVPWLRVPDAF